MQLLVNFNIYLLAHVHIMICTHAYSCSVFNGSYAYLIDHEYCSVCFSDCPQCNNYIPYVHVHWHTGVCANVCFNVLVTHVMTQNMYASST